jgi:hypothetical protein
LVSGATVGFIGEGELIPDTADVDFDELVLGADRTQVHQDDPEVQQRTGAPEVIGLDAVLKARLVKDVSTP